MQVCALTFLAKPSVHQASVLSAVKCSVCLTRWLKTGDLRNMEVYEAHRTSGQELVFIHPGAKACLLLGCLNSPPPFLGF
jgi:hypothetical protein